MTVPGGYKVGATGREMRRADNADGTTTHSYHADDVADFGWTTSPSFIEERRAFNHQTLPSVEMRLLLRPEHRGQETRAVRGRGRGSRALRPVVRRRIPTATSPSWTRPTRATATAWSTRCCSPGAPTGCRLRGVSTTPDSTIIHETGHQWFYGVVASNEFEHGWMDEGITTWATARVIEETRRPNLLAVRTLRRLHPVHARRAAVARGERQPDADLPSRRRGRDARPRRPSATGRARPTPSPTTRRRSGCTRSNAISAGRSMQRVMAAYFDRWKFRHPRPQDFFDVVNEVSGQDLTWFFDQVVRSSNTLRLRRAGDEERSRRAGAHARDRRGAAAGRSDVPGGRRDDVCRRPAGDRALGRQGSPRGLHLRPAVARHARRGRPGPRAAARRQPHQQLADARSRAPRRRRGSGRSPGWSGCRS